MVMFLVIVMPPEDVVHHWQVSSAAPVAAALASGTASEATLSYLYGGSAAEGVSELSMAIPVYEAIGRVRSLLTDPYTCCLCVWCISYMLRHACMLQCACASMSYLRKC